MKTGGSEQVSLPGQTRPAAARREIRILKDAPGLMRAAADEVLRAAEEAVAERGRFSIALAGGTTPRGIYQLLAADHLAGRPMPWANTHWFFGDERNVPPSHPDSNFRMAWESLFGRVPVPRAHIYRMAGERSARAAAAAYEHDLRQHFLPAPDAPPRFDLILLGMGTDGHTASLFPGTPALRESHCWVAHNPVPQLETERITLTFPVLNAAREVLFVVAGADKAATVRRVLSPSAGEEPLPAACVQPGEGRLLWHLDAAAAAHLGGPS
jgi:6-phosphogluconolactonase